MGTLADVTYDDATYHSDDTEEYGLPEESSVTHILAFLAWCAQRRLLADYHATESIALIERTSSPVEIADTYFDRQIDPSMLTEEGNRFAQERYGDYLDRIEALPAVAEYESLYHLPTTWQTVDLYLPVLDDLFARWSRT
ncbi:hypothetical protein GOACH_01_02020 [Gordonia aichiensis NBRC 108223]|uniref:DUF7832 domain-containing protein n=1 Tax=Gordonia aichiensis NBRC 108223 TaxID=1220583 RepID=L7KEG2_9ACTN|nr:hypothetical protein GOACH_01_02020 [Gordonia aichiensis NBRC 108223]